MIKVLSKQVSDKIAAGEVIERPLSIVKEIVENSIDAGATQITLEIKNGGKDHIRITDNGYGIPSDEVETAFLRHATSKLTEVDDLNRIGTLGFRGEALASIAAVSRLTLLTKTADEKTGRKVYLDGGTVIENSPYGCPEGTTITVKDLFFNMPAREKFLKSSRSEASAIIEFITHIAMAYSEIKFRLINNDSIVFTTQGKGDRYKTVLSLTSKEYAQSLVGFMAKDENTRYVINGYVSSPGESRPNRRGQIFFVNGRAVSNKVIEQAIDEAYKDRLFEGRFPIAYIFLEIDPLDLDVNIHPNKTQIRFHKEKEVYKFISEAIRTAITHKQAIPRIKNESMVAENIKPAISEKIIDEPLPQKKVVDINSILSNYTLQKEEKIKKEQLVQEEIAEFQKITHKDLVFSSLESMGQLFDTYLLFKDKNFLYLVDQHAAQERVFFEKFMGEHKRKSKDGQTLLIPETIDIEKGAVDFLNHIIEDLNSMGFELEEFGNTTYILRSIPFFFKAEDAKNFILDILDLRNEVREFHDEKTWNKIATKACKASIKANDILSQDEISALMESLDSCRNPYSCPHGRPVFLKLSQGQIERRFKRT